MVVLLCGRSISAVRWGALRAIFVLCPVRFVHRHPEQRCRLPRVQAVRLRSLGSGGVWVGAAARRSKVNERAGRRQRPAHQSTSPLGCTPRRTGRS